MGHFAVWKICPAHRRPTISRLLLFCTLPIMYQNQPVFRCPRLPHIQSTKSKLYTVLPVDMSYLFCVTANALFVNLTATSLLSGYSNFVLINRVTHCNTFSAFCYISSLSRPSLSVPATALSYKQEADHQMIEFIEHRHK